MRRLPERAARAVLVSVVAFAVFNVNLRVIGAGDTYPARFLPLGIWEHGTLRLDPILASVAQGNPRAYWVQPGREGHAVSLYPIVLPALLVPFYAPVAAWLTVRGWPRLDLERAAFVMEKLSSAAIAAIACGLMYLLLRRQSPPRQAMVLTLLFAFGTDTWVISSQALWQHGLGELLLVGSLLLATSERAAGGLALLGVLVGLLPCNRPPDLPLALAIGTFTLIRWRGRAAWVAAGAALPIALVAIYNLRVVGALGGAYSRIVQGHFSQPVAVGLAGLLVSPARGLFVFSPFLATILLRARAIVRRAPQPPLAALLLAGAALQILLYATTDWRAGFSFGPRFLTDLLPALVWMLPAALDGIAGIARTAFYAAGIVAAAIQAIGAFTYQGYSDQRLFHASADPGSTAEAWNWRTFSPLEASHGLAPRNLLHLPTAAATAVEALSWPQILRGDVNHIAGERPRPRMIVPARPLVVDGWALADLDPPSAVGVLIDGRVAAVTTEFFDRPDVNRHFGRRVGPSGWRVTVAKPVPPGPHRLAVMAQTHLRRTRVLAAIELMVASGS